MLDYGSLVRFDSRVNDIISHSIGKQGSGGWPKWNDRIGHLGSRLPHNHHIYIQRTTFQCNRCDIEFFLLFFHNIIILIIINELNIFYWNFLIKIWANVPVSKAIFERQIIQYGRQAWIARKTHAEDKTLT